MTTAPTILVVEDNPTTRKMLRVALTIEGYRVVEAADARSALAAVAESLPDLVLQDLVLPDMDGLDLLNRLRALLGGRELPILALSGFLSRIEEAQTEHQGFTALLVKPIEPSRLIDAVRIHLPRPATPTASLGQGRRLLVVDDDPVQLKLTRLHLTQLGFEVAAAASGAAALVAARAARPDVIVSDVFMPDLDGFQLCLEVRRDPALMHLPVVLLSAQYGSQADQDLARRVGAHALVVRTPDFGAAIPAIMEALGTRTPPPVEQPSPQFELRHARLVIHQLERQVAATAGLAQRCGIQASQLSLLSGVADALTRRSDPDVNMRDVLATTLDAAGISKGALILRDGAGALALLQAIGFSAAERLRLEDFFGHGALLETIVRRGASVAIPSAAVPDDASRDILAGARVAAVQIVPLISKGLGVGAMIIGASSRNVTSDDSVAFARAMGNQVVQSLELARSIARLDASEQRYRTLLESASDFIAVLTPDGIVREMNHPWVELTGLPAVQLVGRHIRDFAPPGRPDGAIPPHNGAAGTWWPCVEIARSDGASAFVEFSSTNVDVGGERLVLKIGRDVTERVRGEDAARDVARQKDEFLAMLAHELRNPLAPIRSAIGLLERQPGRTPTGTHAINVIQRQVAHMVRLVDDLLDVSRTTLNTIQLRRQRVTLDAVIGGAVEAITPLITEADQTLVVQRPLPPVWLDADGARLVQVFSNLIHNAVKFTPRSGRLAISAEQDADTVTIRVTDNGIGFTDIFQPRIFDMYSQEDTRLERSKGGLGVGLALAKALVVMHGGRIEARSAGRGLGAEFAVTLPTVRAPPAGVAALPAVAVANAAGRRLRVLVVDDNVDAAVMLQAFVSSLGCDTTIAFDGPSGLARAHTFRPDLVLLDIGLPGMTGYEVTRALRKDRFLTDVYLAAVTGWGTEDDKNRARDAGFDVHLTKPVDLDVIEALTARLAHTVNCQGCDQCLKSASRAS